MNESYSNASASASSTSSLNSSSHDDTEDDQTIAKILAEEEEHSAKVDRRLGKRLSHLDSIPVRFYTSLLLLETLRLKCDFLESCSMGDHRKITPVVAKSIRELHFFLSSCKTTEFDTWTHFYA